MALLASLISTFNRISSTDRFRVISTGESQLVGLSTFSIMSSAISFSSSTSSLGLLWGCATGSIAGSTSKSTCTPFIFPIPLKRPAYSPTSFLIAVSFNWTEFATSTRPRSLAVWNPINGSVFVHPFITWNIARAILLPDSTITSNFSITFSGTIWLSSVWKACSTLEMLSVWPCQPVTVEKVHLSMTLTVTPMSTNTWNSQFSTLIHLMGLRFCLSSTAPTFSILQRDSVSLLSEGSSSQKVLTASLSTISLILQHLVKWSSSPM